MGYRKIIGFGDSSFVVSLPKEWVGRNGLKKGDVVNVQDDGTELKIVSQNINFVKNIKQDVIVFDGNLKRLKARLFKSYIDDCDLITITKKQIDDSINDIKKLINDNFIALEVLQSGNDKIVIKDFLNVADISVYDMVRRMDRIVMSMFEDVREILKGDFSKKDYIFDRDNEVNKIYNLLLRILKRAINPADRKLLKLETIDIPYYWDFVASIEGIGDLLKRMVRTIDSKPEKEVLDIYNELYELYKKAVKANFSKDLELGVEVMHSRKSFADECDKHINRFGYEYYLIIEKIKFIGIYSDNIAKNYIKLGPQ